MPETEGIKYAGSKLKIMPHILPPTQNTNAKTILDGFFGTTRIAQDLARLGYQVIANKASSVFEEFRRNPATGRYVAVEAIKRVLRKTKARHTAGRAEKT